MLLFLADTWTCERQLLFLPYVHVMNCLFHVELIDSLHYARTIHLLEYLAEDLRCHVHNA